MEIRIRLITSQDLPDIAAVFADAYKQENTGEHWTVDTGLGVVKYWHNRAPQDLQVLAEADGKIIGALFVDVEPWWNGNRIIDGEFFVLTGYRNTEPAKTCCTELSKRPKKHINADNLKQQHSFRKKIIH